MQKDPAKTYYRTTLASLSSTVDNLRRMCGAVRHAFNRSSLAELEEVERFQDKIVLDLDDFFTEVESAQAESSNGRQPYLKKLHRVLGHLEHMGDIMSKMSEPIQRKIKEATMVSDRDFFHLNDLFVRTMGLMRGLADLFHAENPPLKRYLVAEANNQIEGCFQAETEHETVMTQSFGQPHAFAIYLDLLGKIKLILNHMIDIVRIMDERVEIPGVKAKDH